MSTTRSLVAVEWNYYLKSKSFLFFRKNAIDKLYKYITILYNIYNIIYKIIFQNAFMKRVNIIDNYDFKIKNMVNTMRQPAMSIKGMRA